MILWLVLVMIVDVEVAGLKLLEQRRLEMDVESAKFFEKGFIFEQWMMSMRSKMHSFT